VRVLVSVSVCVCVRVCVYVRAYMHARVYAFSLAGTYLVSGRDRRVTERGSPVHVCSQAREASHMICISVCMYIHLLTCACKPMRPHI